MKRTKTDSNLEGDSLDIEEQLLEVEAEAGYAINLTNEEINPEEQAMSGSVDDLSSQIEHMVPRSELELEKRRVAKWKRRADERRICANCYYKDVCALEDKLESSHRRFRNLLCRTNKRVQADRHHSKVAFTARVKDKKL
nr:hypothetical protein [Tanacetum cinerariifolium]